MYSNNATPNLAEIQSLLAETPFLNTFHTCATNYQNALIEWVDHRKNVIRVLKDACNEIDAYRKYCLIGTMAGSAIGLVSAGVLFMCPPLAIGAMIAGVAGSVTSGTSQMVKLAVRNAKVKQLREYVERDRELWEEVLKCDEKLAGLINRIMENEGFQQKQLQHEIDIRAMSLFAPPSTKSGVRGDMAIFLKNITLTDDVKVALQSVVAVSTLLDTINLVKCAKDLTTNCELAEEIRHICRTMEDGLNAVLVYAERNSFPLNDPLFLFL